jgi:large subunit ribosomal protein L28
MTRACEITGKKVVVGRNVSRTKGHPTRTSRDFVPNLKNTKFKSDILNKNVVLRIATNTLRTINKFGGFDVFILNFKKNKLTDKAKKIRKDVEKVLLKSGDVNSFKNVKQKRKRFDKKVRPKTIEKSDNKE